MVESPGSKLFVENDEEWNQRVKILIEKSERKWQHSETYAGESHLTLQLILGNVVDLTMNVGGLFAFVRCVAHGRNPLNIKCRVIITE